MSLQLTTHMVNISEFLVSASKLSDYIPGNKLHTWINNQALKYKDTKDESFWIDLGYDIEYHTITKPNRRLADRLSAISCARNARETMKQKLKRNGFARLSNETEHADYEGLKNSINW